MLERERDAKEEEDMEGKEGGDDESSLRISSGKKKNKPFYLLIPVAWSYTECMR